MFSLFRVVSFALLALSLLQLIDAYAVRRVPAGSNGERLAKRLPLPRPKRLYDPYRHVARQGPSVLPTSVASSTPISSSPSGAPTSAPSSAPPSSLAPSSLPPSSPPPSSLPPSSVPSSTPSSTPTSQAPSATRTGYIALETINAGTPTKRDSYLGYMGTLGMASALPQPGVNTPSAWTYKYVVPQAADDAISFSVVEEGNEAPDMSARLGALSLSGFNCPTLEAGSTGYLGLINFYDATSAGSATCTYLYGVAGTQGYGKTLIFTVDPETDEITVQWVNPDGSVSETYVAEYSDVEWSYAIYVTGDLTKLATTLGTTVDSLNVVKLYFNEISAS
ncbi:hypothetical protein NM688_g591 [Phlebia brevispora]|uniref:Uncharacterized protein n=1 Tax=Phlebia brevispora TaxID=194682 RepID=A0ACC1TE58_9APHY|nr:hypothetical protein NM688_g591 [Phlebia brevispora]